MLTFCINSTRGRGGHESPRWIRALGKGDGRTNRTFGSQPLRTLSSHGDNTDSWRGPLAVLNGRNVDVSILRPPYLCRWLCRTRSLPYRSHAGTFPNTSKGGHVLTSFRDHTSGHREIETAHPLVTGSALPYSPIPYWWTVGGLSFFLVGFLSAG